jgi:hypothetical protein
MFIKLASAFTCGVEKTERFQALLLLFLLALGTLAVSCRHRVLTDKELALRLGIPADEVVELRRKQGLTATDLERITPKALREVRMELRRPERSDDVVDVQDLQSGNETGFVDNNSARKALENLERTQARAAVDVRCLMTSAQETGPCRWVPIGPGNIGGRIRSIAISPEDPQLLWAATPGGGIWRSRNGGASFEPVNDRMINLVVTSIVIDPTDSRVVYAATGEGFWRNDNLQRGIGIFRTTDAENWALIDATGQQQPDFRFTNKLAISSDGRILLAATNGGLMRSEDREHRADWSKTLPEKMADVEFHPTDTQRAVAAGLTNGKAYFTTDGGQSWAESSHPGTWEGRIELVYAVADPSVVYAAVGGQDSSTVWKSVDSGKTYQMMKTVSHEDHNPVNYLGNLGWYGTTIWAGDPNNKDFIILGGLDLWKSEDGGQSLIRISDHHSPGSVHVDQHCIVSDPRFGKKSETGEVISKKVYFCNDGGVTMTDDIYTAGTDEKHILKWSRAGENFGVTQFQGAAGNPTTGTIIGGAQDNATLRYTEADGPEGWKEIFIEGGGGDGTVCAADPTNANLFYMELPRLSLHRSTDGGLTAEDISGRYTDMSGEPATKPVPYKIPDAFSKKNDVRANFLAPILLDPNNPNRMLVGGLSLWRSNNVSEPNIKGKAESGPQWFEIKGSTGTRISTIEIAKTDSNIIWVGDNNGGVFKTVDGLKDKPTWKPVDENGSQPLPDRMCDRITIDPKDPQIVYVVFTGYSSGNIWKTTDGGMNWRQLDHTNSLPKAPVYDLAIHPQNSRLLYIATEVGVFASDDRGLDWSAMNQGPTSCPARELFWMNNTLVVATYGRGMFKIDLTLPNIVARLTCFGELPGRPGEANANGFFATGCEPSRAFSSLNSLTINSDSQWLRGPLAVEARF